MIDTLSKIFLIHPDLFVTLHFVKNSGSSKIIQNVFWKILSNAFGDEDCVGPKFPRMRNEQLSFVWCPVVPDLGNFTIFRKLRYDKKSRCFHQKTLCRNSIMARTQTTECMETHGIYMDIRDNLHRCLWTAAGHLWLSI